MLDKLQEHFGCLQCQAVRQAAEFLLGYGSRTSERGSDYLLCIDVLLHGRVSQKEGRAENPKTSKRQYTHAQMKWGVFCSVMWGKLGVLAAGTVMLFTCKNMFHTDPLPSFAPTFGFLPIHLGPSSCMAAVCGIFATRW